MEKYRLSELSDTQLAIQVQAGATEAFGLLVARYEGKLLRYGRRFLFDTEDITDIVQDVFLASYRHIQTYDPGRPFSPWLYRIAHNRFANELRRRGRRPLLFVDFDTFLPHLVAQETADGGTLLAEDREAVERVLSTLDPKYREPVILYYFEDMDYEDIAEVLHIPVSTVGVRLKRARQKLKAALSDKAAN